MNRQRLSVAVGWLMAAALIVFVARPHVAERGLAGAVAYLSGGLALGLAISIMAMTVLDLIAGRPTVLGALGRAALRRGRQHVAIIRGWVPESAGQARHARRRASDEARNRALAEPMVGTGPGMLPPPPGVTIGRPALAVHRLAYTPADYVGAGGPLTSMMSSPGEMVCSCSRRFPGILGEQYQVAVIDGPERMVYIGETTADSHFRIPARLVIDDRTGAIVTPDDPRFTDPTPHRVEISPTYGRAW